MKILLTGASGYIGKRLLTVLCEQGHLVICCVRSKKRFYIPEKHKAQVSLFEVDFSQEVNSVHAPADFDIAFYLIHSLGSSIGKFEEEEQATAHHFVDLVNHSKARQIIYLTGIVNEKKLSAHLHSRKAVEEVLKTSKVPLTVLRAAIIVGSGSASFEILRDLVEKLPVMIAPKWINNRIQPIGVHDVMKYLTGVMLHPQCTGQAFDIGGPDILTYREMMLQFAEVRHLKRKIITVPVMTPRLSSYWLYFITSTSYNIAVNLVDSLKIEVVCKDRRLEEILKINPMPYKETVQLAFKRIEQNMVVSSWKDSFISSAEQDKILEYIQVPEFGCLKDSQSFEITGDAEKVKDRIWSIGGRKGWYYADFLWGLRGLIDKIAGGVGLRRGRTNPDTINSGDALDFWRVILSDRAKGKLLLYAEMKLPGEAWLEYRIIEKENKKYLQQTATFRPIGLLGRLYWYSMLPFHFFIFKGMAKRLVNVS